MLINIIKLLFIIILPISALAQNSNNSPYLLLYAFDAEGVVLKQNMQIDTTETILGREVCNGKIRGVDIVLAESGIGLTNASMTTQKLIDRFHPKGIIFSGIAGGIDSTVQIGDIVVCSCWVTHDYAYYGAEGMKPGKIDIYSPADEKIVEKREFCVDSMLLAEASELSHGDIGLDKIGDRLPAIIVGGTCVSGNSFIEIVDIAV